MILCKTCIFIYDPEVLYVGDSGNPGEVRWAPTTILDPVEPTKPPKLPSHPDGRFQALQPEDSYETEKPLFERVPVGEELSNGRKRWISPGASYLRVTFQSWVESPQITDTLRRRWNKYGELYGGEILAPPIPVRLKIPADAPDCDY